MNATITAPPRSASTIDRTPHPRPRLLALLCVAVASIASALAADQAAPPPDQAVVFEGARVIVGDGRPPIADAAFIVEHGVFSGVGRSSDLPRPARAIRVDLRGKTVMPSIVDAHVHLGYRKGLSFSADNYTRQTLRDTFDRFAYFGVAAVLEAGTAIGVLPFELRRDASLSVVYRTAGRGVAMPNAGPGVPMRDAAYGVTTEPEARQAVRELAARQVDMVKIWVDDRDGTVEKLKPNLYRAIIDEAHAHRLRVMAHVIALDDTKNLLRAGVDGFAHPVKDQDIDAELLAMLGQRPQVFVLETLWGERRALYDDVPSWANEPTLHETMSDGDIAQLREAFTGRTPESRERGARVMRNIAKLSAAGVNMGLGTDTGGVTGGQYFGFASQIELALLVRCGLTPSQAITVGTANSSRILRLADRGTIERGKTADFIVLDGNPLEDIANTRRIARVYRRGYELDRTALRASWRATPLH